MSLLDTVSDFLDEHKSGIAFGAGLILTGATTVLAVKATPKAIDDIRDLENELGDRLTWWQKVKVSWKHYILPVATEIAGVTCLVFGRHVDIKATEVAVEVANASQKLLRDYSKKVAEEIGEQKEGEIRRNAIRESSKPLAERPIKGSEACSLFDGDSWYVDIMSGKKFIASEIKIRAAINLINKRLNSDGQASLNDFYEEIYNQTPIPINEDLAKGEMGDFLGFTADGGLLDVDFEQSVNGIIVNGTRVPAFDMIFTYEKRSGYTRIPDLIINV